MVESESESMTHFWSQGICVPRPNSRLHAHSPSQFTALSEKGIKKRDKKWIETALQFTHPKNKLSNDLEE
jgi:hypothetical protein